MKKPLLLALVLCAALPLAAGDFAKFVNLGFSANSRYFMFGQYGIDDQTAYPYAEIYVVDVPANDFVPGTSDRVEIPIPASVTQEGQGALYTLLPDLVPTRDRLGIEHVRTGTYLYVLVNGVEPKPELDFRDFVAGRRFKVKLMQTVEDNGAKFHIAMTVSTASGSKDYVVGLPNYVRPGVRSYKIRQILLTPDGNSLIFVIEKEIEVDDGTDIRFMVETVRLRS